MKYKTSFLSFGIFIFLVLGISLTLWQNFVINKTYTSDIPEAQDILSLPVELTNHDINAVYISYNFSGIVKDIKKEGSNFKITIDTNEKSTPVFDVVDSTLIYKVYPASEPTVAKSSDITSGSRISLAVTYDLMTNEWITRTIHIIL